MTPRFAIGLSPYPGGISVRLLSPGHAHLNDQEPHYQCCARGSYNHVDRWIFKISFLTSFRYATRSCLLDFTDALCYTSPSEARKGGLA